MPLPWEDEFDGQRKPWEDFGPQVGVGEDVAKSGASGVARGAADLVGAPSMFKAAADVGPAISEYGRSVMPDWMGPGFDVQDKILGGLGAAMDYVPSGEDLRGVLSGLTGGATDYQPQTTAGEYASTIGEFAPAALAGPGSAIRRGVTQALLPALGSETGGQLTEGTAAEPYARIAGGLLGAVAPSATRRIVSPLPVSPQRQEMVNTLRREGVDLTAGQASGRKGLQYRESELGGSAGARFMEQQGEQFTAAALRRAGVDANRATPEVIDGAFTRIGQQFDDLAARNQVVADPKLASDLRTTLNDYSQSIGSGSKAPIVESTVRDIASDIQATGALTGERYKQFATRVRDAARKTSSPELREAMHGLREALDDAMDRSLASIGSPDMAAWREARRQYRNILVIEKAATGAGESAAMGIISPSQLRNATVQQGRRAYARGKGDFADLTRAGEATMKPLPQSGTAPRIKAQNLGAGMMSLLGAGGGAAAGGPIGFALGAAGGAALPAMLGRTLLSRPGRAYLGNQRIGPGMTEPRIGALGAALLSRQEQR